MVKRCYKAGDLSDVKVQNASNTPTLQLWKRVLSLRPEDSSMFCLREDIDVDQLVQACKAWNERASQAYSKLYTTPCWGNGEQNGTLWGDKPFGFQLLSLGQWFHDAGAEVPQCNLSDIEKADPPALFQLAKQMNTSEYDDLHLEQNFKSLVFTQLQLPTFVAPVKAKQMTDPLNCAMFENSVRHSCSFEIKSENQQELLSRFYRKKAISVQFWVKAQTPSSFEPKNGFYDKGFAPFVSILRSINSTLGLSRLVTIFPLAIQKNSHLLFELGLNGFTYHVGNIPRDRVMRDLQAYVHFVDISSHKHSLEGL